MKYLKFAMVLRNCSSTFIYQLLLNMFVILLTEEVDIAEQRRRAQSVLGRAESAVQSTKRALDRRTNKYRQHSKTVVKRAITKKR